MRNTNKLTLALAAYAFSTLASAYTLDFELNSIGNYTKIDDAGVTITYTGNSGTFDVVESGSPGDPIHGHALLSLTANGYDPSPFKMSFSAPTNYVQVGVGDYDQDEDHTFMQAFDVQGKLLSSDSYLNPIGKVGGGYLTVSSTSNIAYVLFWDQYPNPGAVYWDHITYQLNPVPEPEAYALLLAGLGLLAAFKRKTSNPRV